MAADATSMPQRQGTCPRKANEVHAGAASDVEHTPAALPVEVHEPQQVVQLFEVILVEIGEESRGSDRVRRDGEIVDVRVPVPAYRARASIR